MISLFNRMKLEEAFELLLNRKIIASEFNQASKVINKLKDADWRLWFGRFLLFVRSDAENSRFTDAYICLSEAEKLVNSSDDPAVKEEFLSMLNNESLFLEFKFYYDATGISSVALLLARFYYNGWGVKQNLEKAYKTAKVAAEMKERDPLYIEAREVLNSILIEMSQEK